MIFTYNDNLATNLDKVRFYIGDTSSATGAGIKPDGTNFSNDEINGLITIEGSWQKAVAGAYETLAAAYANLVDLTLGPRKEAFSQASDRYTKLAETWRKKYGTTSATRAGMRHPTRIDGYSQTVPSDEV